MPPHLTERCPPEQPPGPTTMDPIYLSAHKYLQALLVFPFVHRTDGGMKSLGPNRIRPTLLLKSEEIGTR
jgi:hypothetical protein